jgi:hypothetical protein
MNFLSRLQKTIVRGIAALSGRASTLFRKRKPVFPLADRILADALRIAEIPSPSPAEEERASFVLDRLRLLDTAPWIDGGGNVYLRIHSDLVIDEPPLLLFTDLGSKRWHPLESLSRLDAVHARGAGLADVLGTAALLYAAEVLVSGRVKIGRDVLLLFAARAFDDPESRVFVSLTENHADRPFAAVGIQGFTLGSMVTHAQGSYRMEITAGTQRKEREAEEADDPEPPKPESPSNLVVDVLIAAAAELSGFWAADDRIRFYIHRIKAGAGYGRTPSEGILEIELESADGALLDTAMNTVKTTVERIAAERAGKNPELRTAVNVTSFIPAGDPAVTAGLSRVLRDIMKDLRIKFREVNGADPSAFLSNCGIPAVSLGIASGWEGLTRDTIEIASIEKGRQLLDRSIQELSAGFAEAPGLPPERERR